MAQHLLEPGGMETLTPELERRLQVEEARARRIVLCESMNNAPDLDRYQSKRLVLSINGTGRLAEDLAEDTASQGQSTAKGMVGWPTTKTSLIGRVPQSGLLQGILGAAAATILVVIGLSHPGAPVSRMDHLL